MALKVGDKAKFKGYAELDPGQDEILIAGEEVTVAEYDGEADSYTVTAVADATRADTLFAEEMEEIAQEAAEAAPKRRTRAAAPKRRTRAAAAKAAPAEEEAPAKAAPKAKGRAKAAPAAEKAEEAPAKPAAKTSAKAAPEAEAEPAKAAPAKAAPAKVSGLVVIETISDMIGSHETALASAKEITERLAEIREQEEETLFSLGGLLAYINNEEAYKSLGYEDIASYSESELGLKKRRTEYYIRLYTELTEAGVTVKEIEGIGWTKLRTLLGVIDKTNKKELLGKAKKMSRDDLEDHMKEVKARINKASPTSDVPEFVKFPAFKLFKDQGTSFEAAIKSAQEKFQTDNMAEALFYMATEWLQEQDADVPLDDALAALDARYGTNYSGAEEGTTEDEEQENAA